MNEVPMMWTARGNVPMSEVDGPAATWEIVTGPEQYLEYVKMTETWRFKDGEIASESVHVYKPTGVAGSSAAGSFS